MVAKKSGSKKSVIKKDAPKDASKTKGGIARKKAVGKLKTEVGEVKKEAINKLNAVKKEITETSNKSTTSEQPNSFAIKTFSKQNLLQNQGKIGIVNNGVARATGHRKTAIAKVSCSKKNGKLTIFVNDLDYKTFFTKLIHQEIVCAPFVLLGINTGYVVNAEVFGGGKTGQADALKLGLSRCLSLLSEEYAKILRKNSFLTRDARRVEPKKAGLKKARKKEQFSKR